MSSEKPETPVKEEDGNDAHEKERSQCVEIEVKGDPEIEELRGQLLRERQELEDVMRKMLYLQADFENYRNRIQAQIGEISASAKEQLISEILPILDELELAIRAGERIDEAKSIVNGIKMALNNLYNVLKRNGLMKIEAVGKQFDPRLHEAIERVPNPNLPDGQIIEEVRNGFMIGGKVIRPSIVKVSYLPKSSEGQGGEKE